MSAEETRRGGCHCRGVEFEITSKAPSVTFCHCENCRRTTGHFHAAIGIKVKNFELTKSDSLKWYSSSEGIRRGFCNTCGGNLFWQRDGGEHMSIQAGMFDMPTGLQGGRHIFVASKGDYYEINDDLPKADKW